MPVTDTLAHLPAAMRARKPFNTGLARIDRGVWILVMDAGAWKILAFVALGMLLVSGIPWLPGGTQAVPAMKVGLTGLFWALAIGVFWWSSRLHRRNRVVARIDPQRAVVVFSMYRGDKPVPVPISRCYLHVSQTTVEHRSFGPDGGISGISHPRLVGLWIGTAKTWKQAAHRATVAVHLPYEHILEGLTPLASLGPWAGIVIDDDNAAMLEEVRSQVHAAAQGRIPVILPALTSDYLAAR